jgi:exodeoxyribonuclease-3
MKIISWNVNGLRAVYKKNFLSWFKKTPADIYCLQEIKAQTKDIPQEFNNLAGYNSFYSFAHKKGYSGVAVYSKEKPLAVTNKIGFKKFEQEGRFLRLDFKKFILINIYLPQGDRTKKNIPYKLESYHRLLTYLQKIKSKPVVLIGDFNIAHTELDLARPQYNKKNTMFTPAERQMLDQIIKHGMIDTFRYFNKQNKNYTWWPYYYNARQRNIGWRLDYCFINKHLIKKLKQAYILKDVKGSDHCPIGIELQ